MLLFNIDQNIVYQDVCTADELMLAVVRGDKLLQLICSISGMGKTTRAKKLARAHGIVPQKDSDRPGVLRRGGRFLEDRPKGVISLVRTLWYCHIHGIDLLMLDDPGKIAFDEDCCDLLKFGFGVQRIVMHRTPEISRNAMFKRDKPHRYDPSIPDERFILTLLRMLWLSNTNFTDPAILAKLGDHFFPLIARGLNPFWIRDDRENDNHDLFLYVWWEATENKLLRGMGFPYRITAQAVNFYVAHAHDLVDLSPRSLERIAHACANPIPRVREAELTSMLSKRGDLRPKLKLPTSWIQVIDGVPTGELVWPDTPRRDLTRPETPPQEPEKPEPDPEPPPQARQPDPDPDPQPEPQPQPPLPLLAGPRPQPEMPDLDAPGDDDEPDDEPVVICLPDDSLREPSEPPWRVSSRTVNSNMSTDAMLHLLLRQRDWDIDDYREFARFRLEATWHRASEEQQQRIHDYVFHATGVTALVYGTDAVIEMDEPTGELHLTPWPVVMERLAPAIAEARAAADRRQREADAMRILKVKLPPKRKFKKVRSLLDQLLALEPEGISEQGRRGIAAIQAMRGDTDALADCKTFSEYVLKAGEEKGAP